MPSFQKGLSAEGCGGDSPAKLSKPQILPIAEPGALGHLMQAIDPRPLEDAKFSKDARYVPTFEVQ
jgi:hypothetical protein